MAVAVAMVAFAQTTEPAIESVPASDQPAALNSSPTGDENRTDKDTSVQTEQPVAVEVEIQRRENALRSERLDDREANLNRWFWGISIFITIVVAVGGYIIKEIKRDRDKSDEMVRSLNAKTAVDNPKEVNQVVKVVLKTPKASLIDKAIAQAVSLQQQGGRNEAVKKWRAIAHIAESIDNDLAGRAWFSIGYLLQDKDPEGGVSAYDQVLRLTPDSAEAYTNRGIARTALERYDDAIADHNEAIRLKPDYAKAYTNRGSAKAALERYDDAIADFNEALRLKPDFAVAYYNRGLSEAALGLESEVKKDFETALKLARNANDADLLGHVERVLRNHAAESS